AVHRLRGIPIVTVSKNLPVSNPQPPSRPEPLQADPLSTQPTGLPKRHSCRRTIFVECSNTFREKELNTGIQRVVRNILHNAKAAGEKYGCESAAVLMENGRLVEVDTSGLWSGSQEKSILVVEQKPAISLDDYGSHTGNALLLLDASWAVPDIWAAVERFKT